MRIANKTIFPPTRLLASILFILAIISLPIACQKNGQQSTSETDLASQQAAKQKILALIEKNGKTITVHGTFAAVKHVSGYTFHNEIDADDGSL